MDAPYTSKDKNYVTILAALLFILVSSPVFYKTFLYPFGLADIHGLPTIFGTIVAAVVFAIIVRILIK